MATVTTSTSSGATLYPNQRRTRRFGINGGDLDMLYDGTNLAFRYSRDGFATVIIPGTGATIAGVNGDLAIDPGDGIHVAAASSTGVAFFCGTPTFDTSGNLTGITWSAALSLASSSSENYPAQAVHKDGANVFSEVVWSSQSGTTNQVKYARVKVAGGTPTIDAAAAVIAGSFAAAAPTYPAITQKPGSALFLCALTTGATGAGKGLRALPGTWSGTAMTWGAQEPIDETTTANAGSTGITLAVDSQGRFAVACSAASVTMAWERSAAGVWSKIYDTGASGATPAHSLAVDGQDAWYLFYAGAGTTGLNYIRYIRSSKTWTTFVTLDGAQCYGPSARPSPVVGAIAVTATRGTASPYTVVHYVISVAMGGGKTSRRGYNAPIIGRGHRGVITV